TVAGATPLAGIADSGVVALHEQDGTFETALPITASVPSTGYTSAASGQTFQWKTGGVDVTRPGSTTATVTPQAADLGTVLQLQVGITYPAGYDDDQTALFSFAPVAAAPVLTASAEVAAGSKVSVAGTGFAPSTTYSIELHSSPVVLGTVTTSASGALSSSFAIPADTAVGAHQLVAYDPNGNAVATADLTVTAAPQPAAAPALAATGAGFVAPIGLGAAGALLLGLALLLVALRRRHRLAR
ncbi:MAG: hypothetical protein JWO10_748, partial [Microbacteriaceae bacterium]|nr:hypothetical protein [Microbacteriaceae bacterium]